MSKQARLEVDVQREIEALIGAEPDLLVLKNSVGQAQYFTDDGRKFFVPYGLGVGSPDIVCLLLVYGVAVWLCIEVKAAGEKPKPEQEKCHAQWRRFGALIAVVDTAHNAPAVLDQAREEARERIARGMKEKKGRAA